MCEEGGEGKRAPVVTIVGVISTSLSAISFSSSPSFFPRFYVIRANPHSWQFHPLPTILRHCRPSRYICISVPAHHLVLQPSLLGLSYINFFFFLFLSFPRSPIAITN